MTLWCCIFFIFANLSLSAEIKVHQRVKKLEQEVHQVLMQEQLFELAQFEQQLEQETQSQQRLATLEAEQKRMLDQQEQELAAEDRKAPFSYRPLITIPICMTPWLVARSKTTQRFVPETIAAIIGTIKAGKWFFAAGVGITSLWYMRRQIGAALHGTCRLKREMQRKAMKELHASMEKLQQDIKAERQEQKTKLEAAAAGMKNEFDRLKKELARQQQEDKAALEVLDKNIENKIARWEKRIQELQKALEDALKSVESQHQATAHLQQAAREQHQQAKHDAATKTQVEVLLKKVQEVMAQVQRVKGLEPKKKRTVFQKIFGSKKQPSSSTTAPQEQKTT